MALKFHVLRKVNYLKSTGALRTQALKLIIKNIVKP